MTLLLIAATTVAMAAALCFALGRYQQLEALREWEWLLTQRCMEAIDELTRDLELDARMATSAFDAARGTMDLVEAKRLLALAYSVLQRALPGRLGRLRGMAICIRMAGAIAPLAALPPAHFHLRSVRTLAGAAAGLHHVLVGMRERFGLRVAVVAWGFRLALHSFGAAGSASDWRRADAALRDWKLLDAAHVASFDAMLRSLDAELRLATARSR